MPTAWSAIVVERPFDGPESDDTPLARPMSQRNAAADWALLIGTARALLQRSNAYVASTTTGTTNQIAETVRGSRVAASTAMASTPVSRADASCTPAVHVT